MQQTPLLSPSPQNSTPWIEVKKDWIYQRKKTLIFKSWQPRFMVLYRGPVPAIALYEQRSDSVPPYAPALHVELSAACRVEAWKPNTDGAALTGSKETVTAHPVESTTDFIRRGSMTSLAASEQLRFQQRSKKQNEENAFVLYKADFKLVIATNSIQERNDWIERIKEVIAGSGSGTQEVAIAEGAEASAQSSKRPSLTPQAQAQGNGAGLTLLGVTVIKESKLTRLQANQPTLLLSQSFSDDSILNEISLSKDGVTSKASEKLISNIFPEELISLYYQSLKAYKSADSEESVVKAQLHLNRVLGSFNDAVLKYVRLIIDEYHKKVPVSSTAVYEFGPIKISLLPGYNQNDESIIEYTSAVNRQELHAAKMINGCSGTQVNTMLLTCVEYKGFRFSAYLEVPLGSNTITVDLNPQDGKGILLKDDQLDVLNGLGTALKLTPASHIRLPGDNRSVALCLPASVELHQLPRSVAGYPKGPYVLNLSQIPPAWPLSNPDDPLLCGLYRFRPEFISSCYQGPLSAGDFNADKSAAAHKFLLEEHLPAVLDELESLEEMPVDSAEWTQYLHSKGVNCVLMGRMAGGARLPHIKEALMIEMIGRTAKRAIAAQLRGSILHFKEVQALRVDDELRAIVLHTMATIVGNTPVQMQGYVRELLDAVYFKFGFRVDLESFRRLPRAALFLAICHHSGLQFVDRVYDFGQEAPFAKEDFLMFIPTADSVIAPSSTLYSIFCKGANTASSSSGNSIVDAVSETEALAKLAAVVLPQGDASWQYPTGRASIARQMLLCSALHARQKRPSEASKFAELARATVPRVHPLRAFIHLQSMEQRVAAFKASPSIASSMAQRELLADLKRQYAQAVAEVDALLGPHHPLQICVHQQAAQVFASLGTGASQGALNESLQARGNALASATKSLGRIHKWTRQQVLKIGDVNKELGAVDEALTFYNDALKSAQQCGDGAVTCAQILLSIAGCQQAKGNLDEALEAAQEARSLLESTGAVDLYESALTSVAQLAQSLYEDVKEDATTALSGAIQANLSLAVECYERLFEGVRQRAEIDPAKLLSVLKKIISLKMRLARPAQKILLSAIRARKHQVNQAAVSDCIMRIVSAPTASAFMDRNLERLEKPALAAAITSGSVASGEAKEIFEEFSCLLQIVEN